MENKYYTPEIEEFHIGFEYELNEGYSEFISEWWIEQEFDFRDPERVNNFLDKIRVKYLDKEDIESLGWKMDTEYPRCILFTNRKNCYLNYWLDSKIIEISSEEGSDNYFQGYCKNKSELKKLMKQLNICQDKEQ